MSLLCLIEIGQIGIFLELIGAFILVLAAFRSKRKAEEIKATNETNATWEDLARASFIIKKTILDQAKIELWGFVFLGLGLILQFVGGVVE